MDLNIKHLGGKTMRIGFGELIIILALIAIIIVIIRKVTKKKG